MSFLREFNFSGLKASKTALFDILETFLFYCNFVQIDFTENMSSRQFLNFHTPVKKIFKSQCGYFIFISPSQILRESNFWSAKNSKYTIFSTEICFDNASKWKIQSFWKCQSQIGNLERREFRKLISHKILDWEKISET